MFTMDVPYIPAQETPIVLAQADTAVGSTPQPDYLLKVCENTTSNVNDKTAAIRSIDPGYALANYLNSQSDKQVVFDLASIKNITLLEGTKHGKLVEQKDDEGLISYYYDPITNYVGDDRAVFMAKFEGKVYKIVMNLKVTFSVDNYLCPDNPYELIKVKKPSTGSSGYDMGSISVTFADLDGSAIGLTNASGITLDTNAAGHNWFIDTTPWDNSEYLPTSNPYEWVAKEGTAAYGKMDMLSVLLHEYGHALGIDHSADNHDYMATTLTPGVRRMPSAEEMALMQSLVGQIKGEEVATGSTPTPALPLQGGGGLPIPLGAGFGMAFIGRMRKGSYGSSIDAVGAQFIAPNTQYAVAANATFANLATPAGWNTQGSVNINPATIDPSTGSGRTASVTLSEVSTSQTRLSQVFMLNEQDRYLSFTLSGTALDDLNGAPDDAFEVALLDANTGANLLGGIGLSHSDAFLNIQGDGTEHAAAGVTRTDNPDGSRTYRVDLSAVAKNNAVNLSFDLLGFGQNNSHVTLSDIRVSGLPQLIDDAASLAEDNLLSFDPFVQADAALRPLLAAAIVTGPTHGAVTVNADGSFAYTPDLDYFGTDSFSYRLSDGPLDSNLATVSLTVTAVNDAPVAADVALTTAEDTVLVIALGAYGSDVDSAPSLIRGGWEGFATQIVTGPAHGSLIANADGTYSYTPDLNYFGADSFTYKANDGELDSNIATVSLTITAVNDAPVAVDTQAVTDEDTALSLDLLAAASDVDGDVLMPVIIAGPLHGQLIQNADGTFNYLSDPDYFGTDSFTYQVHDGFVGAQFIAPDSLSSNIATVSLTINAVNDAPVAVAASVNGTEDTPYIFTWSDFKVSDVDSTDLAINIDTLPADGLLQHFDGIQWLAIASGQRITKADIDAGYLCFGPDVNESGFAGYGLAGTGNNMQNYASFTYHADDGPVGAQFIAPTNQSDIVTMTVNIIPAADAPSLALAGEVDVYGASALRFTTGWEIAPNRNPTFTILPQDELEGWNVVKEAGDNGQGAFVIWSTGDKMKDAANTNRIVNAATANSKNWLELGDAMGLGHQTWGIERTVDTRAGVAYTLSLDYAGRLGYGIDFTGIGIYVDGIKIATHAGTSPNTALNWEALNFSFTGTGAAQTG